MLRPAHQRGTPPSAAPFVASDLVALWFTLAQRSWTSLALVPADPHGSSEELARSLVEVGKRFSEVPVTAITMTSLDALSARSLANLQRHAHRDGTRALAPAEAVESAPTRVEHADHAVTQSGLEVKSEPWHLGQPELPGSGRVVISIPSVIEEPFGLGVAQASSLVAVAGVLGRTRIANMNRTIDLIGRERIAGCIVL